MSIINWVNLENLGDERGSLISIEAEKNIPFKVKRIYYISKTKENISRGFHAHKELTQAAICVNGKCRMLLDNGKKKQEVWLDSANKALIIGPMIWREMYDFSNDCILLVLASEYYDESDYIRDYKEFLEYIPQ